MSQLDLLRAQFPDYASDVAFNLDQLLDQASLSPAQTWGSAIAAAATCDSPALRDALIQDAKEAGVSDETLEDARAAAVLMAVSNIYYRFQHMMQGSDYATMRARFRMKRVAQPAGERADFELFAIAASVITGCEQCVKAHEQGALRHGLTPAHVHECVRVAAVIHGVAAALR